MAFDQAQTSMDDVLHTYGLVSTCLRQRWSAASRPERVGIW